MHLAIRAAHDATSTQVTSSTRAAKLPANWVGVTGCGRNRPAGRPVCGRLVLSALLDSYRKGSAPYPPHTPACAHVLQPQPRTL
jgi:hypothetical protein